MPSFEDLGLAPEILATLKQRGFEEPTPIQALAIPAMLTGARDVIGQAQTGTGKTAAFGLPIIQLLKEKSGSVQALVLAPTRELAIQVAEQLYSLKGQKRLSVAPIYGGQAISIQLKSLRKGVDIVVGTPGRVIDHLKRGTLDLSHITHLVLDEADEMLNMGFLEDVSEILEKTPKDKRVMLFSATMPKAILQIAKKYMRDYDTLKVTTSDLTSSRTTQIYFEVTEANKFDALCRIIDMEEDFYGLIFCRTKLDVDRVSGHLNERGYDADAIHGDVTQMLREKILGRFKNRAVNILIATDVAARGIDVQGISHVINYSLPPDPEAYVHRIGRTGRAGKEGSAITFVTPSESRKLYAIQQKVKTDIRKQKLPQVKDIIAIKKRRIQNQVYELINQKLQPEYQDLARDLLAGNNPPEDVVTALLQSAFAGELDEKSYAPIKDVVVDTSGKTRLFVGFGQKDGLTPKKLARIMEEECGVPAAHIRDVQVLEKFSFISLPFKEAEMVLAYFQKGKKGALYVTKAKGKPGADERGKPSFGDRGKPAFRDKAKPSYSGKGKPAYSARVKPAASAKRK